MAGKYKTYETYSFNFYSLFYCRVDKVLLTARNKLTSKRCDIKDGFVPNAATAIKIAEAVLVNIYSEESMDRPLKATLSKKGVWMVCATLPDGYKGGVPYIEIQKIDGKILYVIHGK